MMLTSSLLCQVGPLLDPLLVTVTIILVSQQVNAQKIIGSVGTVVVIVLILLCVRLRYFHTFAISLSFFLRAVIVKGEKS
jgi:hypothetical protein